MCRTPRKVGCERIKQRSRSEWKWEEKTNLLMRGFSRLKQSTRLLFRIQKTSSSLHASSETTLASRCCRSRCCRSRCCRSRCCRPARSGTRARRTFSTSATTANQSTRVCVKAPFLHSLSLRAYHGTKTFPGNAS